MLSFVDLQNPLLWAVLIGWILSVVLHEFAHGVVAYFGGDYTIRERGGLTLNPLQYIDPMMSIVFPIIFLLMGGIPLPGGVTYVRRDLLRGPLWSSAVSVAGPAMNFLLFLILALAFRASVGPAAMSSPPPIPRTSAMQTTQPTSLAATWTTAQTFLGAMALLQLLATLLNLVPIPPLDGFGIISPYLPKELRENLSRPQVGIVLLLFFFVVVMRMPVVWDALRAIMDRVSSWIGVDFWAMLEAYRSAFGS